MNNALRFHMKISLINMVKRTLKRPMKTIGALFLIAYFLAIPFTVKSMVSDLGFDTPEGFVLVNTAMSIYIMMPATLSYFKRKGVLFRKQDVNFMFASPISPKQILFYALLKQAFMSVLMQVVSMMAAIFLFKISVPVALFFGLSNFIFSSLLSYSLAIIMYGSERLSEKTKETFKWIVYGLLISVTGFIAFYLIHNGVSVESATSLVSHPFILSIPIFGWELGWLNLVILGVTPVRLITGILFILTSVLLTWFAYKMESTGAYYEDALQFSERQARLEAKKGDVSFNDVFDKKRKVYERDSKLKGQFAKAIFSRQIVERRRTRRFFISLSDLVYLLMGIGAGVLTYYGEFESELFFPIASGVSLYLAIFFNPSPTWKDEFSKYFLFVIPDTMRHKLWYATMMEHLISLIRAVFIAVPFGLIIGASFLDIVLVIMTQLLLKAMIVYKSILIDGYVGAKIGKITAQFVSIAVSVIIVIIPMIAIVGSSLISVMGSFAIVAGYSLVMMFVFMYLCVRVLSNIESLND